MPLKKHIDLSIQSGWLISIMLLLASAVQAQPCLEVRHSSDKHNICSCVWGNHSESYDVGLLHVDSENQFSDQYDGVAQSLRVGEYTPISGDALNDNTYVDSTKQTIVYDALGRVQTIFNYISPFLDPDTGVMTAPRMHYKAYNSSGSVIGNTIYIPSSVSIGLPNETYTFRNPT